MKEFVHCAQEEVGRQRTVSDRAAGAGFQMDLDDRLDEIDSSKAIDLVEKWLTTAGAHELSADRERFKGPPATPFKVPV